MFDEADVLAFAEGQVRHVFGDRYALVDRLPKRVRVPGPPMLAISRVTEISGRIGCFEGARITTEFDIPPGYWNSIDGQASALVLDPQGVQFLLGWLGVDLETRGVCSFRWVAGELIYRSSLPRVGQTVRTEVRLRRSIRSGNAILFDVGFDSYVSGRLVVTGERCLVGMFPLDRSAAGPNRQAREPDALVGDPLSRSDGVWGLERAQFETKDLVEFARKGGAELRGLRFPPRIGQFLDRVWRVDPAGGRFGLGFSTAEVGLDPLHWCVRAHFKDDPVFPGPCVLEGATQLLQAHLVAVAEPSFVQGMRFEPVPNQRVRIRFYSQIVPCNQKLRYRASIVRKCSERMPVLLADVECECEGVVTGRIEGIGVRIACEGGGP